MTRVAGALIVLLVAGFPAAAPPPVPIAAAAPPVCITTGAVTYQLAPTTVAADYRVKIAPSAADLRLDLRLELVDEVETADFALVDDGAADPASADETCDGGGVVKTVQAVDEGAPANVTVSLANAGSADEGAPRLKLFVHSTRVRARDAAVLFAAMRHDETAGRKLAQAH
jgi:hypothetical protein